MTNTTVKDVGSFPANLATSQNSKGASGQGGFQAVWSSQMNRGAQSAYNGFTGNTAQFNGVKSSGAAQNSSVQNSSVQNSSVQNSSVQNSSVQNGSTQNSSDQSDSNNTDAVNAANRQDTDNSQVQQTDSAAAQDGEGKGTAVDEAGQTSVGTEMNPAESEELSAEELEQAMEVLNTAALGLMQQIADAFGITMEELQATMEDLGLAPVDVLNASELGNLLLKLGGAEDSYALITDGVLYDNYQTLMAQSADTLKETAQALDMQPEELAQLLENASVKEALTQESAATTEIVKEVPEQNSSKQQNADVTVVSEELKPGVDVENVRGRQDADGQDDSQAENQYDGQQQKAMAQGEMAEEAAGNTAGAGQAADSRVQEKHAGVKADKSEYGNIFTDNLRAQQFEPELQQAESIPQGTAWSADTRNIMNQIMDYMKLQLNADATNLEMQLHPASLGTLQVQIASKGGILTANFITQNEAVKAALESQVAQLRNSFEEQGVKVEAIEVTVQTHEFERNLEQGRGRDQQQPEKKNRTRKINLNDPLSMEDLEEEDALAAEMLAASGSTVEYTV